MKPACPPPTTIEEAVDYANKVNCHSMVETAKDIWICEHCGAWIPDMKGDYMDPDITEGGWFWRCFGSD